MAGVKPNRVKDALFSKTNNPKSVVKGERKNNIRIFI